METREKFGIEMRGSVRRRLNAQAKLRGLKLYEAIEEAANLYLGDPTAEEPAARIPLQYTHYMEKLARILASGDMPTIEAVTVLLDVTLDRLRPVEARDDRRAGKPSQ